jgi:quercetin dioxygenase-like cupin family protein
MDRTAFEAELEREGYAPVEVERGPDTDKADHAHDFDARLLVLDGVLTITIAGAARTCRAGETFTVPAGVRHTEHAGPAGARFLLGKRRKAGFA